MQFIYSKEVMEKAVRESFSISGVWQNLNVPNYGSGTRYKQFKLYKKEYDLDTSHFTGQAHSKGKNIASKNKRPIEEFLQKDTMVSTSSFRKRLIREGLLENKCSICNLTEWLGQPISLQLDHMNGDNLDNRIENLRILCPNCHAQTDNYCGKNAKKPFKIKNPYRHLTKKCSCGTAITHNAIKCLDCYHTSKEKIVWPEIEVFQKMLWETPSSVIAKNLGVSDNAIKARAKKFNLTKPPRGYWMQKSCSSLAQTRTENPEGTPP